MSHAHLSLAALAAEKIARIAAETQLAQTGVSRGDTEVLDNSQVLAATVGKRPRTIPRPKGNAGGSKAQDGFNLQEQMGLADDSDQYNSILVSFHFR